MCPLCWSLCLPSFVCFVFFFNDPATTEIYTLSLHDALPIFVLRDVAEHGRLGERRDHGRRPGHPDGWQNADRSEEHTSELQSLRHLVCRLLLEKKKKTK